MSRIDTSWSQGFLRKLPSKPRRPMSRGAKIFCIFSWVLVLSTIALEGVHHRQGAKQRKKALAAVRAAGFSSQPLALKPEPVPSWENGAPLLAAAFPMLADFDSEGDINTQGIYNEEDAPLTPELLALVREKAPKHRDAFELIRRARMKPAIRFERDWSKGLSMPLPEFAEGLTAAWALSLLAQFEASEGRLTEAREIVKDLLAIGNAYRDEPIGISQIARREHSVRAAWTAAHCARYARSVEDLDSFLSLVPDPSTLQDSTSLMLKGEIAIWTWDLDNRCSEAAEKLLIGDSWMDRLLMEAYFRSTLRIGGAKGIRKMLREFHASQGPLHEAYPAVRKIERGRSNYSLWEVDAVSWNSPSEFLRVCGKRQATLAVILAGLQCERFWLIAGQYPARVDVLDPFTGKPLIYDREQGTIWIRGPVDGGKDSSYAEQESLVWRLWQPRD